MPRFDVIKLVMKRATLKECIYVNIQNRPDPINDVCLLPDCQISGNCLSYRPVQIFKILFRGSNAQESDLSQHIGVHYWQDGVSLQGSNTDGNPFVWVCRMETPRMGLSRVI